MTVTSITHFLFFVNLFLTGTIQTVTSQKAQYKAIFKGFRPGKSNRSSCLVSREGKSPLRGLGNWDRLPPLRAPCRPQRWAPPSAQGGRGPCGGGPCPSPPSSPRTKQNFLCLLPSWGPLGAPTEQKPNFVQFGGLPCCWAGRLSRLWRGSPPAPSSRPPPGGGLPD